MRTDANVSRAIAELKNAKSAYNLGMALKQYANVKNLINETRFVSFSIILIYVFHK